MLKELSAAKLEEVQGGVTDNSATNGSAGAASIVSGSTPGLPGTVAQGGAASGDNVIRNSGTTIIGNATGIVVPRVVVPRVVRPVRGQ